MGIFGDIKKMYNKIIFLLYLICGISSEGRIRTFQFEAVGSIPAFRSKNNYYFLKK